MKLIYPFAKYFDHVLYAKNCVRQSSHELDMLSALVKSIVYWKLMNKLLQCSMTSADRVL